LKFAIGTALLLLAAVPSAAWTKPSAAETAAAAAAEQRGLQMYAYDQAAWKATDRFKVDVAKAGGVPKLRERGLRGYVVEPLPDGLQVVFYGVKDDRTFVLARYLVADQRVTGDGILKPDATNDMSPLGLRMVAALAKAGEEMVKPDHGVCSKTAPNSLVLPQDDGSLAVYILTSTIDPNLYPAGGHYRFDFDAYGQLKGERRFMTGCFPIDLKARPKSDKPALLALTHELDPQPTEIHSFVSQNVPIPMAVVTTSNRHLWLVAKGKISYIRDMAASELAGSAAKNESPEDGAVTDAPELDKKEDTSPAKDLPPGR
jgi:hypothetical protein